MDRNRGNERIAEKKCKVDVEKQKTENRKRGGKIENTDVVGLKQV
jgi:hypothetical protein